VLLRDIIDRNARMYPNRPATVWGNIGHTFGEFKQRVNRIANALMNLGVAKGDRVAILLRNCSPYIELYFGIPQAGMIMVPLNYRNREKELSYILNHSGANTLFVGHDFVELIDSIRKEIAGVKNFISIGQKVEGYLEYEALISQSSERELRIESSEDDIIGLGYTSGTTGRPKGVMFTHKNVLTEVHNSHACVSITPEDVGLNFFPFFHVGFVRSVTYMARGVVNICADFSPQVACELIEKHRVTHAALTPAQVNLLVNYPEVKNHDLSSLRKIICGGGHTPLATLKKFFEIIPKDFEIFWVTLGLTEAVACLTGIAIRREMLGDLEKKVDSFKGRRPSGVSVGTALPYFQIRIVDDQDRDVPAWVPGEVLGYGDNVMKGYWRMPEATAETLRGGWLHTGDIGVFTEEGEIYIVDRKKDMILSGDENVYPAEVEEVLYSHPSVLEAAVIGVPDKKWGETVKGIVVLKPGARATEGEIIEFCKERLSSYKKPTSIDFLPQLPRNPSGKVLKTELRKRYWAKEDA
jgi:acyl-CoA synthetase (AMP-forming)/AMP-acid ligase II